MAEKERIEKYLRLEGQYQEAVNAERKLAKQLGVSTDGIFQMPHVPEELRDNPEIRALSEGRDRAISSLPPELATAVRHSQELLGLYTNEQTKLVCWLARSGKSEKQIASDLSLSEAQVRMCLDSH
jgi:DNA-binding NarL/FixJ family response regulator